MRLRGRCFMMLAVGLGVLVGVQPVVAAPTVDAIGLPAPFDQWDVTSEPGTDPHVQWVDFDSAILQRRVSMRVVLPDAYATATDPLPVVYYLHGTIRIGTAPAVDDLADQLAANGADVGYPFGAGSARNEASYLVAEASRLQFVVVSPDAERGDPWCEHCGWVDGLNDQGVDAESHLLDEVMPLTEAMFRVRTDRAGRGVMGASMGGAGALIQATRHPDLFSVVAALSPPVDYIYDAPYADFLWFLYLRQQGYPAPVVRPMPSRSVNPADLLDNLRGQNIDTIITVGDGCVLEAGNDLCQETTAADEPINSMQEIFIRHNLDLFVPSAIAAGVPVSYITYPGVHFSVNHTIFNRHLLDRMNADFARGAPAPASFTFRSADHAFGIWGYDVSIRRLNDEFVTVDARTDGTAVTITGTGTMELRTPPVYAPGSSHTVAVEPSDGQAAPFVQTVVADASGRLRMSVYLGPTGLLDEVGPLVALGVVTSPQTRIAVLD